MIRLNQFLYTNQMRSVEEEKKLEKSPFKKAISFKDGFGIYCDLVWIYLNENDNNKCIDKCIFSLDNSEWMRNGDYMPTRLEAQHDAGTKRY